MQMVSIPRHNPDLPEEIKMEFLEAEKIFFYSPKSAAAIMRTAIENLCKYLGSEGNSMDEHIHSLIGWGLLPSFYNLLVNAKVCGEHAVSPGKIAGSDDKNMALSLFYIVNMITDQFISHSQQIGYVEEILAGKWAIENQPPAPELTKTAAAVTTEGIKATVNNPTLRSVPEVKPMTSAAVPRSSEPVAECRCRNIIHKEKKIFVADFSNLDNHMDRIQHVINEVKNKIVHEPVNSVLIITYVGGLHFDTQILEKLTEYMAFNKPYIKASAVVGVEGIKKLGLLSLLKNSLRDVNTFETEEAALDWLAGQG